MGGGGDGGQMGRRAHASTDLYVRSGDTSGLIVIIVHASVNAGGCRASVRSADQYFVVSSSSFVRSLVAAPGLHRPVRLSRVGFAACRLHGSDSAADAASRDKHALSDA